MRRTPVFAVVLLGIVVTSGVFVERACAKEKVTLSSLVGRLLNIRKSKRDEPEERPPEQPSVRQSSVRQLEQRQLEQRPAEPRQAPISTVQSRARQLPEGRVRPPVEVWQPNVTQARVASQSTSALESQRQAPFPPVFNRTWVKPPEQREETTYSLSDVRDLTRNPQTVESSRRRYQALAGPTSEMPIHAASPTESPAFAKTSYSINDDVRKDIVRKDIVRPDIARHDIVRPASHVTESPSPAGATRESAPIGNRPAEVGKYSTDEPRPLEPPLLTMPIAIAEGAVAESSAPSVAPTLPPVFQKVRGQIATIDAATGVIRVALLEDETLPVGAKIRVYRTGESIGVNLQVLGSASGVAAAKVIDGSPLDSIALGDTTVAWKTDVN